MRRPLPDKAHDVPPCRLQSPLTRRADRLIVNVGIRWVLQRFENLRLESRDIAHAEDRGAPPQFIAAVKSRPHSVRMPVLWCAHGCLQHATTDVLRNVG